MRVYINPPGPFTGDKPVNGIQQVINAQYEFGSKIGWHITHNPSAADVVASHAGTSSGEGTTVAHCHGLYPTGMRKFDLHYSKTNMRVIQDLRKARIVTVPSQWVADILRRDMHLDPYVIPHGIDISKWPERTEGQGKTILWNKNRDMDVCDTHPVIQAAAVLSDHGFQTVSTFGQGKGIRTIGVVPFNEMRDHLYSSHIYLATTRETFGIGTLEAMAAGLPIVGYDWGATPDIVTPESGILVPPNDMEALCDAVMEVSQHWHDYSEAARERAADFPWSHAIELYDYVYKKSITPHEGPLVTIGIPCYNYAHKIHVAINSVKAQTFRDFECIIVDDGSSDNSSEVVKDLIKGDPRFHLVRQANGGVASARNYVAYHGKGEYIAFLDADDALDPRWLEVTAKHMLREPLSTGIVYTGILVHIDQGKGESKFRPSNHWPNQCSYVEQARRKNQVPTCNLMRKEAFLRTGGYRQRFFPAEDADLWTRFGSIGYDMKKVSDEHLFIYTIHEHSATQQIRRGANAEPDWLSEHPWTGLRNIPFANILPPANGLSHPVRDYDQPEVAVVIPVGPGHEGYALHAIDSVEAQTFWNWELIVVDDTEHQSLELYGRPFAKLLRTGGKKGPSVARNMGGDAAKAPLLIFLDADDYLLSTYIESVISVFEPGTFIYTDWYSEDGKHHQVKEFEEEKVRVKGVAPVTFVHEKDVFKKVRFDESLDGWEDWDYTIGIAAAGCCGLRLPEPLFVYRTLSGSRREDSFGNIDTLLPKIKKKWEDVPMGCRGCGGRRLPRTSSTTQSTQTTSNPLANISSSPAPPPNFQAVQIVYVGRTRGRRLVTVPGTGVRYRYDSDSPILWVRPEHVSFFEGRPDFRVLSPAPVFKEEKAPAAMGPSPTQPVQPDPPAQPAPPVPESIPPTREEIEEPPAPIQPDPPEIRGPNYSIIIPEFLETQGIGTRQINALENAGLFEEVERLYLMADEGRLTNLSGIGSTTADRIAEALQKFRMADQHA